MTKDSSRDLTVGILFGGFVATVVAANYAVTHFDPIPVWPAVYAPAGVLFAGLAFTLRDLLQRFSGSWPIVVTAILVGTGVSLLLGDGRVALAGATAFLLSELVDFGIFAALQRRSFLTAVAVSNAVGLLVDSLVFLLLAFGSLAFLPGQVIGKVWMTGLALLFLLPARKALPQPA